MRRGVRAVLVAALLSAAAWSSPPEPVVLDSFAGISGWAAAPSEGVRLDLREGAGRTGGALRLDFDFQGHAGWAAARKAFSRRLPENWVLSFSLRGDAPPETLEFKLLDPTGENVWWSVRRGFEFPREWSTLRYRKRQVSFAWGPARGGELKNLGWIEITVTAGSGGRGSVWIDDLAIEESPPEAGSLPPPRSWKSPSAGPDQALVLDLGGRREFGGLVLEWDAADFARRYDIEVSDDGARWSPARSLSVARGGPAWIPLPDSEAAFVRIRMSESSRGRGYALRRVQVEPPEFSETPTKFLEAVASDAPRGRWPRSLRGEQIYWTLVGVDGGREKGLLSEDGALETGSGSFSLEPFLRVGGRVLGWADADVGQSLVEGDLPIPVVTRKHPGGLSLEITALADGPREASTLRARYRVRNAAASPARATLYVAMRPVQVNPPWQFLNVPGGFAPIRRVAFDGTAVRVNGERRVVPLTPPSAFSATRFDDGEIVARLFEGGALPRAGEAVDEGGLASACPRLGARRARRRGARRRRHRAPLGFGGAGSRGGLVGARSRFRGARPGRGAILARGARPGLVRPAAGGAADRARPAVEPGLDPHEPGRARDSAGDALVCALVDSRRGAHGRRAPSPGPRRGGA